jgi:hypothetical protein
MKNLTLISFFILFKICLFAQVKVVLNQKGCGFSQDSVSQEFYTWDASNEAREYVKKICDATGITANFSIKRAPVANAFATIDNENHRIIYYSESFFSSLNNETFKIAILAHEIGHHLNNNIFSNDGKRIIDELDADKFSGFVLAKLGLQIEDAKQLLNMVCSVQGEENYPPRSDRIEAFSVGFENGKSAIKKADENNKKTESKKSITYDPNDECARNNTGDVCFINLTGFKIRIRFDETIPDPNAFGGYRSVVLNLEPNETSCLYGVSAKSHSIQYEYEEHSWGGATTKSKEFKVNKCATENNTEPVKLK